MLLKELLSTSVLIFKNFLLIKYTIDAKVSTIIL